MVMHSPSSRSCPTPPPPWRPSLLHWKATQEAEQGFLVPARQPMTPLSWRLQLAHGDCVQLYMHGPVHGSRTYVQSCSFVS
jgi:hypothetical protein